jgi:hypothetical protein
MANADLYQKYISDIVGGMMPSIRQQQKGMYDFTMANALRTGNTSQAVQEGMASYAHAAGEGAAKAGAQASQQAQRQEQFDKQQENWKKNFEQTQENWEKQMAMREEENRMRNMMNMFEHTGWTPELLEAMGYDDMSKSDMARFQKYDSPFGPGQQGGGGGGFWDQPGNNTGYGHWNNWGGRTGLVYAR